MLLRSFVSEATWVGSCLSGGSRLETRDISGNCCVTSPGSQCWNHGAVCCWFHDVTALARSWTLQMVGFKARVQRTGFQVVLARSWTASCENRKRDFAHWCVVLNSPIWTLPQAAGRIRVSVWGGAPPMSRVSGARPMSSDISFIS